MLERNVMSTTKSLDTLSPATATTAAGTLNRSLSVWNSLTIGFAVVSTVVGLHAIIGVQMRADLGYPCTKPSQERPWYPD